MEIACWGSMMDRAGVYRLVGVSVDPGERRDPRDAGKRE